MCKYLILLLIICFDVECQKFDFVEQSKIFFENASFHDGRESVSSFRSEWVVTIDGGLEMALHVAGKLGYKFGGIVLGFSNTYVFYEADQGVKRGGHRSAGAMPRKLMTNVHVQWAEQLFDKVRVKRLFIPDSESREVIREKRIEANVLDDTPADGNPSSEPNDMFNDVMWSKEWYLHDQAIKLDQYTLPSLDLNVLPVYRMGFNGRGIRVCILDDGIEYTHDDLKDNYDPDISWDCNDSDSDPFPHYDRLGRNSHGTRCAGEIAMKANNSMCGVGVAFGCSIGGVRLLDGGVNDRVEGEALGFAWNKVDIYSASWGPSDDGRQVEGPGTLAKSAILRGIREGRGGKGVIYVWANGNGGGNHDNCNCDGYASSMYTVSIASANREGKSPYYAEKCSSTIATTYSSDMNRNYKIATTDLGNQCTLKHSGTSAAAPLAAGCIALVLQANPSLTWRDVQHLIIWTSACSPLADNEGWIINGAGFAYNPRFGFGVLNAAAMVNEALSWRNVPEQYSCRIKSYLPIIYKLRKNSGLKISSYNEARVDFDVRNCDLWVEHVELTINIQYSRRGALAVLLTSPQGTRMELLSERRLDNSTAGFRNWPLVSLATWGERSDGKWIAEVVDRMGFKESGILESLTLIIYGTKQQVVYT